MIEATIAKEIPAIKTKKIKFKKVGKKEAIFCRDIFTIESINLAMQELDLNYKSLNECDLYNVIAYIIEQGR